MSAPHQYDVNHVDERPHVLLVQAFVVGVLAVLVTSDVSRRIRKAEVNSVGEVLPYCIPVHVGEVLERRCILRDVLHQLFF